MLSPLAKRELDRSHHRDEPHGANWKKDLVFVWGGDNHLAVRSCLGSDEDGRDAPGMAGIMKIREV